MRTKQVFPMHRAVLCCDVDCHRRRIVWGGDSRSLHIWCLDSEEPKHSDLELFDVDGHVGAPVTCVMFLSDGRVLSGGSDSRLVLWDNDTGGSNAVLLGHTGLVSQVSVSSDDCIAISASHDTTCRVWNLVTCEQLVSLEGHTSPILELAWSPGHILVTGSKNGQVIMWDLRE